MINFKSLQITFIYSFLFCICLIGHNLEADDNYLNGGREHEALREYITHLNEEIEINPQNADLYFESGLAKLRLGRNQEAINDYNTGIRINPNNAYAYYYRGLAKARLGKYQEAIIDIDRAIEMDPQFAQAYYYRGRIKATLRRYREAAADYNTAMKMNPQLTNDILLDFKLVEIMVERKSRACASPLI